MNAPRSMNACIVALGARTAVGLRAGPSAAAVRAGLTRLAEHPSMVDRTGDPFRVCMDSTLDAVGRLRRMQALAISALEEVLEPMPVTPEQTVPILLGVPEPSDIPPVMIDRMTAGVAAALSPRCRAHIVPVREGNASVIVALERALAGIADRTIECCIVGGVDSWIDADVLEALDADKRVLSVSNRWGVPPGEGAAMLAVCSHAFARQSGLRPRAWIAAAVTTMEANLARTDSVCTGEGLGQAFTQAAARAGASVTKQYCDLDGDRYREHEFSFAILRAPPAAFVNAVDYVAPADCWGSVGAATGAMLATLPVLHHERGFSPGPWPMVWCGSDNGRRGALVLHLEPRPG
ncbi:MAG: hypothetical protein K1X88_34515 [Nannocystaceae bacterium]|nr:hypothetical protein [Nannocystaceae bacterium]